jgi:hypothetical protein
MMASSDYAPTVIDGRQCIWLQGIGWHAAKPLGDVAMGDILVYNYGATARVQDVRPNASGRSVAMTVVSIDRNGRDGKVYGTTPRRATTLVAVKGV